MILDGVRILVVDDEPDSLELMVLVLESMCGATVFSASSAEAGLALARRAAPHVLLSDLSMPFRDGYWLVREVSAAAIGMVSIAVTGYGYREHGGKALAAGFNDYIEKPVDPQDVCARIARVMNR